jgi:hypothetical protein
VDPLVLVLLAGLGAMILWMWLLGTHNPGAELSAHNARGRATGKRELTVAHVERWHGA